MTTSGGKKKVVPGFVTAPETAQAPHLQLTSPPRAISLCPVRPHKGNPLRETRAPEIKTPATSRTTKTTPSLSPRSGLVERISKCLDQHVSKASCAMHNHAHLPRSSPFISAGLSPSQPGKRG